ncbi:hypothetical protein [Amycolatopsis sp. FDAARGOS 1241]|uniref:hypothetical protein n=1 Tax=Amycolatopsis sp. FDAARGOS 1241 TaxID=2778070 RepID=UPI001EF217CA|nr:hypothetical protein [Amycolatopsis sp. FDAARGOS 1241]
MGTTTRGWRAALLLVPCALGLALGTAPARADGAPAGTDIQVAQTLGARELTVIIRRIDVTPGDLHVDVATHAGTAPGPLHLAAAADGAVFSRGDVVLGATPGLYSGSVGVDHPGPWELRLSDGTTTATIPFVVPARVVPPWEKAAYGGFAAAGAFLLIALAVAVRTRRTAYALVPGGGMIVNIVHTERVQAGPYGLTVGFSTWPVLAIGPRLHLHPGRRHRPEDGDAVDVQPVHRPLPAPPPPRAAPAQVRRVGSGHPRPVHRRGRGSSGSCSTGEGTGELANLRVLQQPGPPMGLSWATSSLPLIGLAPHPRPPPRRRRPGCRSSHDGRERFDAPGRRPRRAAGESVAAGFLLPRRSRIPIAMRSGATCRLVTAGFRSLNRCRLPAAQSVPAFGRSTNAGFPTTWSP